MRWVQGHSVSQVGARCLHTPSSPSCCPPGFAHCSCVHNVFSTETQKTPVIRVGSGERVASGVLGLPRGDSCFQGPPSPWTALAGCRHSPACSEQCCSNLDPRHQPECSTPEGINAAGGVRGGGKALSSLLVTGPLLPPRREPLSPRSTSRACCPEV